MDIFVKTDKAENIIATKEEFLDLLATFIGEYRNKKTPRIVFTVVEPEKCDGVAELDGLPFRATVAKE